MKFATHSVPYEILGNPIPEAFGIRFDYSDPNDINLAAWFDGFYRPFNFRCARLTDGILRRRHPPGKSYYGLRGTIPYNRNVDIDDVAIL